MVDADTTEPAALRRDDPRAGGAVVDLPGRTHVGEAVPRDGRPRSDRFASTAETADPVDALAGGTPAGPLAATGGVPDE